MKIMSASDFKAQCLAILDQVHETREPVTITKRGKPVAQLVPPLHKEDGYPQDELRGSVRIVGDLLKPVVPSGEWEAESGRK